MSKKQLRVLDYLEHIKQAIERIERYTSDIDEVGFMKNEMAQDAVIRNVEIVGEAANNIMKCDADFAKQHNDVPWAVIYAMRNRVSHGYHTVDLGIVWQSVQTDLPLLGQKVVALLNILEHDSSSPPFAKVEGNENLPPS